MLITNPTTKILTGALAIGTHYVDLPVGDASLVALMISSLDVTGAAAITLHTTLDKDVAFDTNDLELWQDESVATANPVAIAAVATAVASEVVHLNSLGAPRARLKIVATAITTLAIYVHRKLK